MKKFLIPCLAGVLIFSACDNSGSSTVGVYEQEQPAAQEHQEGTEGEQEHEKELPAKMDTAQHSTADTMHHSTADTTKAMHE